MPFKPAALTQLRLIAVASLLFLAAAAYSNALQAGIVFDATELLTDPRLAAPAADNFKAIFTGGYWPGEMRSGLYRPLTTLSLLANHTLSSRAESGFGYHAINLLLHLGSAALLFAVLELLCGALAPAWLAAAIWAVHPTGTESVTNIAGRADLLACTAILGAVLVYARSVKAGVPRAARSVSLLFVLALAAAFSKETGILLPALLLLWDLSIASSVPFSRRWPLYAAACAASVIALAARHAVNSHIPAPYFPLVDNPLIALGFFTARFNAVAIIGAYLLQLAWPARLACDYSYAQVPTLGFADPAGWAALIAITAALAFVIRRRRHDPVLFFAAGWFGVTLLPVSNLVIQIGSIRADRFLYLPSIGFALACAVLLLRLAAGRNPVVSGAVYTLAAVAVVACAARTYVRNADWQDSLSLWSHDVEASPSSFKTHKAIAATLWTRDSGANLDRALAEFEQAYRIVERLPDGDFPAALASDLAVCYFDKTHQPGVTPEGVASWHAKAEALLHRAVRADEARDRIYQQAEKARGSAPPILNGIAPAYDNLAFLSVRRKDYRAALNWYRRSWTLTPASANAPLRIAALLNNAGDIDGARRTLLAITILDHESPELVNLLGPLYDALGGGRCARLLGDDGWKLNRECPVVRGDLCAASRDAAALLTEARRFDWARRVTAEAPCSAAPK